MARAVADPAALRRLSRLLAAGGVAIIPCDTIYGIVGSDPEAEQRIRALKGRGEDRPFLRVPAAAWLRELVAGLGRPLLSTSVNRSGCPELWRVSDIEAEFGREVDLVLDGGGLPDAQPSTIVDATVRPCRVLRQGACVVAADDLA